MLDRPSQKFKEKNLKTETSGKNLWAIWYGVIQAISKRCVCITLVVTKILLSLLFHWKKCILVLFVFLSFLQCLSYNNNLTRTAFRMRCPKILFNNQAELRRQKCIEPKFGNRCDTECITDTCIDFSYFSDRYFFSFEMTFFRVWHVVPSEMVRMSWLFNVEKWAFVMKIKTTGPPSMWFIYRCRISSIFGHEWFTFSKQSKAFQQMRKIKIPSRNISFSFNWSASNLGSAKELRWSEYTISNGESCYKCERVMRSWYGKLFKC